MIGYGLMVGLMLLLMVSKVLNLSSRFCYVYVYMCGCLTHLKFSCYEFRFAFCFTKWFDNSCLLTIA